jgi:hypothetical protein
MTLGAAGGLGLIGKGEIAYTGRPSRTTFTLGVTGSLAATGANRAALSYWRQAAGGTNTRVTMAFRNATPEFALWDPSNSWLSASPVFNPSLNTAFRAHAVYEGTTRRRLYINGALANTQTTITAAPGTLDTLRVGSEDSDSAERWNGQVGYVYLYPAALSAEWIAAEFANVNAPASFYGLGSITTEGTGPTPGVIAAAAGPGRGEITITEVTAPVNADTRSLYAADSADDLPASGPLPGAVLLDGAWNGSPITETGLGDSRTRHYREYYENEHGASASNLASATTAARPLPTAPFISAARTSTTENTITLVKAPTEADSLVLYGADSPDDLPADQLPDEKFRLT